MSRGLNLVLVRLKPSVTPLLSLPQSTHRTMTQEPVSPADTKPAGQQDWKEIVNRYARPSTASAVWQIINTFVPYFLLWGVFYLMRDLPWWANIPAVLLAGAFLVRIFIIFHDCGHGSFLASKRANTILGFISGLLTFTPYHHWRWEHSVHHATSGNLDHRGTGDIWTMTVKEYLAASRWKRLAYRVVRNPLVLFGFGPLFIFVVWQRIPSAQARPRERVTVHGMNVALLAVAAVLSWVFGVAHYALLQAGVMMVAGAIGLWMFYVQHQFEEGYWEHDEEWDYAEAALRGSSFYKLPRVFQWFSGNIGFHHIHHLNSRIPNYNLERCHDACPAFQKVQPITLWTSLKTLRLRLWDEEERTMVGYDRLKRRRPQSA